MGFGTDLKWMPQIHCEENKKTGINAPICLRDYGLCVWNQEACFKIYINKRIR